MIFSDVITHHHYAILHHYDAIAHHSCSWLTYTFFMDTLRPLCHLFTYKDKQSFMYKYPGLTPLNNKFSRTPKHDNFLARLTCKYSQLQVSSFSLTGFLPPYCCLCNNWKVALPIVLPIPNLQTKSSSSSSAQIQVQDWACMPELVWTCLNLIWSSGWVIVLMGRMQAHKNTWGRSRWLRQSEWQSTHVGSVSVHQGCLKEPRKSVQGVEACWWALTCMKSVWCQIMVKSQTSDLIYFISHLSHSLNA